MPSLSDEDIAAQAERRAKFRLNHVGTKLNSKEVEALDALVQRRKTTQGELIRSLILTAIDQDLGEETVDPELSEIVGIRLLLTNLLKPLAQGKTLSPEMVESIMTEINNRKRTLALKILKES